MGIGSLFCIIDLLIAPVANVLMKLGCPVDKALSLPVLLLCEFIRNCKILRRTVQLQPHQLISRSKCRLKMICLSGFISTSPREALV